MNKKGNGKIVGVVLIVIIVLGILGYVGSLLLRPAPTTVAPTQTANPADIDRSGAADDGDRMMIRSNLGCAKDQPCWNSTVGKTKDGDNPIYVFDLDLSKDGSITQADIDLVK